MKNVLILTLVGFAGLTACVDSKYDLANVDTDEIVVGDDLIAPLGTGSISVKKLLDVDNVKEINVVNGNYVAQYADSLMVEVPQNVKLEDFSFSDLQLPVPADQLPEGIPLPLDLDVELGSTSSDVNFEYSDEIKRIDAVYFSNEKGASVLALNVKMKGLSLTSGTGFVTLTVNFPKGFKLTPAVNGGIEASELKNGVLTIKRPIQSLTSANGIPLKLLIEEATLEAVNIITYTPVIELKAGAVIRKTSSAPALIINGGCKDLKYKTVFGEFDMNFSSEAGTVDMDGLSDIFNGDDNVLSFADPHIKLETESNIGIPLIASLTLKAMKNTISKSTTINDVLITPAKKPGEQAYNFLWIGAIESSKEDHYMFVRNNDLDGLISISPNTIEFGLKVDAGTAPTQFFTSDAYAKVKYTVEVPFATSKDFRANVSEVIKDAFDDDFVDYVFSGGTATIKAEIKNSVPLKFDMNMVIVDADNKPVGINLQPQPIAGSATGEAVVSNVEFEITAADMKKMKTAKNINIELALSSDEELAGKNLREDQGLDLTLKLKKTGGITINNSTNN